MATRHYMVLFMVVARLCFLGESTYAREKGPQKIAVVLSGGGAKGTAHIGALKVIEKAGIPIDYITGTSMEAIIGALYSIGYTLEELDSLVCSQDCK